jgi:hypothetical protein
MGYYVSMTADEIGDDLRAKHGVDNRQEGNISGNIDPETRKEEGQESRPKSLS